VAIIWRSYKEGLLYAKHRKQFGPAIIEFPPIKQPLANMKMEWLANVQSTWYLTYLDEQIDTGDLTSSDEKYAVYRILVNINKATTSIEASKAADMALEIFGGNGIILDYIRDHNILQRLRDDAKAYEQWEGTHNVLAAQVLNDLRSHEDYLDIFISEIKSLIPENIWDPRVANAVDILNESIDGLCDSIDKARKDAEHGSWHFFRSNEPYKTLMGKLIRALQIALLCKFADDFQDKASAAAAEQLALNCFEHGYSAEDDAEYVARTLEVVGDDLTL